MFEKLSVVICTYGRSSTLFDVLKDLSKQKIRPFEVIIVDQSPDSSVKNTVEQLRKELKYNLCFTGAQSYPKSLTISRNIGIGEISKDSQIVMFLDDDVRLDINYIDAVLEVFDRYDAYGVTGYLDQPKFIIPRIVNIIFHFASYRGRVLHSSEAESIAQIERETDVQWLSGCNMSYKKEVFNKLKFDEKLKRWSYKEDVDFSYRVYKEYGKLYVTPDAKVIHLSDNTARIPKPYEVLMKLAYRLYFSKKHFPNSTKNSVLFWWSMVGTCIQEMFQGVGNEKGTVNKFKMMTVNLIYCIKSVIYIFSNHLAICRGTDPYLFNN